MSPAVKTGSPGLDGGWPTGRSVADSRPPPFRTRLWKGALARECPRPGGKAVRARPPQPLIPPPEVRPYRSWPDACAPGGEAYLPRALPGTRRRPAHGNPMPSSPALATRPRSSPFQISCSIGLVPSPFRRGDPLVPVTRSPVTRPGSQAPRLPALKAQSVGGGCS